MRILLAATVGIFASGALADEQSQAQECARIDDSLRRLTCFDKPFPKVEQGQSSESSSAGSVIQWQLEEGNSPIDDSPRVTAVVTATEASSTGLNNGSAFLMMRCSENTTSVVFATDMFMVNEEVSVTTRFGKEPVSTSQWQRSTNYKAVGLWSDAKAIPFLGRLAEHQNLVVRIQDRDQLNAQFDLGSAREAAKKVADACGWDLGA